MKEDYSWDASAREYVKVYEAARCGGTEKLTDTGSRLRTIAQRQRQQWHPRRSRRLPTRISISPSSRQHSRSWWISGRSGAGPASGSGRPSTSWPRDYDGRVTIGKLNVDDNPAVAGRFSIRGIPTLLLFKGGQIVEQVVGLADKDSLKKLIDKHV